MKALEGLRIKATQGVLIRQWVKHPAFHIYFKKIEEMIEKHKKAWLSGDEKTAKQCVYKAQGLKEALDILVKFQNIGKVAKLQISKHLAEVE